MRVRFSNSFWKAIFAISFALIAACLAILGIPQLLLGYASNLIPSVSKPSLSLMAALPSASVDPTYVRLAEETGGQLFVTPSDEAGLIFNLINPQLTGNVVPILSIKDTLGGGAKSFSVPIDSSIKSITFSVAIDSKNDINLFYPSGSEVIPSDLGVTITDLSSGRIFTINNPKTGNWKLRVSGAGNFSIGAMANSPIQFNRFSQVELTGRPAHEGLFEVAGQPVVGTTNTFLATVFGSTSNASFKLISENGSTIQSITLVKGNSNAASDEFVGKFSLPTTSFRVAVTGQDTKGLPYQRLYSALFKSQSVEIKAKSTISNFPIGTSSTITFEVKNLGSEGTFEFVASDNQNLVTSVQPTSLNLASGSVGTFDVIVTVPTGTPVGTNVVITATATNLSDSTVTNSTIVTGTTSTSASLPAITGLSPLSGAIGDTVTITGTSFTGATAVKFYNGVDASFSIDSDTQITATVPSGTVTGTLQIVTPKGRAGSKTKFRVVTH